VRTPAALFVALVVASALAQAQEAKPDGRELFERKCAMCHGRDGNPPSMFAKKGAPTFASAQWQKATTDAVIRKTALEGREGTLMKGFKDLLTAEEIDAVIAHIRTLGPAK
jgi:mono/diheme cytochrome c family protein